jgi:hypothetical protein
MGRPKRRKHELNVAVEDTLYSLHPTPDKVEAEIAE